MDSLHYIKVAPAFVTVVPDNTTPGSEGRLCLRFVEELAQELAGSRFVDHGTFGQDAVMLVRTADPDKGRAVTPQGQIWWKNGVRDHGVRRNWHAKVYVLEPNLLVVMLARPTEDPAPKLPPAQAVLFT